jgi:hypothetical protein
MLNWIAEGMNRVLKHERVIKDDPDEISRMIGTRTKGKENRKKVRERLVSTYEIQLSGG